MSWWLWLLIIVVSGVALLIVWKTIVWTMRGYPLSDALHFAIWEWGDSDMDNEGYDSYDSFMDD